MLRAIGFAVAAAALLVAVMFYVAPRELPRVRHLEADPARAFDAESILALRGSVEPAGPARPRQTVSFRVVDGATLPLVGNPPANAVTIGAFLTMVRAAQEPRLAGLAGGGVGEADGRVVVTLEPGSAGAVDALTEVLTPAVMDVASIEQSVEVALDERQTAWLDRVRATPDSPFAVALRDVTDAAGPVLRLRRWTASFEQMLAWPGEGAIDSRIVLGLNCARPELISAAIRNQLLDAALDDDVPVPDLRLTILVRQGTPEVARAREIARRIAAEARLLPDGRYWDALRSREFDAFVGPLVAGDPVPIAAHLHSSQARTGLNFFGYTSVECDRLIDRVESAGDARRRAGLVEEVLRHAQGDGVLRVLDSPHPLR